MPYLTEEQIQEYRDGKSLKQIAEEAGISYSTLYQRAKQTERKGKIKLRNLSEAMKTAWRVGRVRYRRPYRYGNWVNCAQCGKRIWRNGSKLVRSNRYFCSVKCHGRWKHGRRVKRGRKYDETVVVEVDRFRCFDWEGIKWYVGGGPNVPRKVRIVRLGQFVYFIRPNYANVLQRPIIPFADTGIVRPGAGRTFSFHGEEWVTPVRHREIKCLYVDGEYRFWTTRRCRNIKVESLSEKRSLQEWLRIMKRL